METTAASTKIMALVTKLLAIAEHPNTPAPEAETALRQANSLITKHAIDEAILRQSQSISDRRAIAKRQIAIGGGSAFRPYLRSILEAAADALRVSYAIQLGTAHCYGAEEDVAWLEMLFSMIRLQFLSQIDPTWDESKGYDANVYTFKVAGYKWVDIDRLAIRNGHPRNESTVHRAWIDTDKEDGYGSMEYWTRVAEYGRVILTFNKKEGRHEVREYNGFYHKLKAAYVRHAKAIGDDTRVVTQSHKAYRLSFVEAFKTTMQRRFWQMEQDAKGAMDTIPGAALAIRDMKDDADKAMWVDFPNLSPEEQARRTEAAREQARQEALRRQEMLDAMTDKEREAFLEKEERETRRNQKAWDAWAKKHSYSWDSSARQRGTAAALSVDLTRKAGSADAGATRAALS